jgi:O-antigen ligase
VVYALPLILVYGAAGWNSNSGMLFAPVRTVRSVGDGEVDRSTFYRDVENYNLVYTFGMNPLLGTGFGHPFELPVTLDDISQGFKEWRYLPHNSILGLLAFAGALGFTGLSSVLVVGLLLGARSYYRARSPEDRVAAAAAVASILIFVIHCWGDIGFTEVKSILLVGPALAIAGQLAVSTGAWPVRPTRPAGSAGGAVGLLSSRTATMVS